MPQFNMRDIGLAVRDSIEWQYIYHYEDKDGELLIHPDFVEATFVDVSDPHNPVVHLSNGQMFRLTITSVG